MSKNIFKNLKYTLIKFFFSEKKRIIQFFIVNKLLKNYYSKLIKKHYDHVLRKKIDQIRNNGFLFPPYNIIIETNFNCNLRCSFCYQRDIRKSIIDQITPQNIQKAILSLGKGNINNVMIMGGESFVRQDIYKIFSIFEDEAISFSITTNGALLDDEKINKLIQYKFLKHIIFSFHGDAKEHDAIVGVPGTFNRSFKALKNITNKRKRVMISTVLTINNAASVQRLIKKLSKLNIEGIILALEFSLGYYPDNQKNKSLNSNSFYENKIIKQINSIKNYARQFNIVIYFPTNLMNKEYLPMMIKKEILKKKISNLVCSDLNTIRIDPSGNLIHCLLSRRIFGNIKKTPLNKLINKLKIRKERMNIAKNKFLFLCEGCCKLDKV